MFILIFGMTSSRGGVPLYHIFSLLSYLKLGMTSLFLFCSVAMLVALCGLLVFYVGHIALRNVAIILCNVVLLPQEITMDLLQFLSTFMTADGVSVGLQGVIIFMMMWQQREIRHMRSDMNKRINRVDKRVNRLDKRVNRVDKRVSRMDGRIDGLVLQVSESNRRVVMP